MISRRSFLGLSAATLATATVLPLARSAYAATPDTFGLKFVNNSGSGTVYAYVTGTTPDGKLVLLRADGTPYYPASPGAPTTPLPEDCAIPIASGAQVTVPKMGGARVYVVTDAKLDFFLDPGPNLVHPSFLNSGDANYGKNWSFSEFTFNDTQLFANISYVDFVGIPMGLSLTTAGSGTSTVQGLPAGSVDQIASSLNALGGEWPGLVQTGGGGNLRVLSPHHHASRFGGYLDAYIDQVWAKYEGTDLVVDSQNPGVGKFTGRVSGGQLVFGAESFAKPATADVWSCDSGPFALAAGASDARKAIVPRLAAALNRTTLLANPNQPTDEDPAKFYQGDVTNHYARIVHSKLPDNRGYAFPYDDVSPGPDFSGAVFAGDPEVLTITVGATHG
ncbi:glycoside hydrolase family 64 protein [Amycolatopsis sp. SID8362]|uniref:glycoside hydrolase family 64 protein n=1 Tax=Amycolatopsis sp. SID8362 TaxID=2690346 RepID=UPI00136B1270|nr:glycoside hydrolase family 64 protein [Amycolatopsis sp. SID8362]NBH10820.1 beta-1,3-glucanase [Amycolatopsis sp. SID8362]NED47514.1 beta-1,3-glucanase [Amycolatopsis sp. SID8362]